MTINEVWLEIQTGTNFRSHLFRLMCKADNNNFKKLAKAFPEEALDWSRWFNQEAD